MAMLPPESGHTDSRKRDRIVVLGAGVIGLTAAIALSDAGYPVTIVAKGFREDTVSAVAAAFWTPFHVEGARPSWARTSLEVFRRLQSVKSAGVRSVGGVEFFESEAHFAQWQERSWWRAIPTVQFKHLPANALPSGFARGVSFDVPVIHMRTYLSWLQEQAREKGVLFQQRLVESLHQIADNCALVVNATGLGAYHLLRDVEVHAVRGQIVCIKASPSLTRLVFMTTGEYNNEPAYIVPRGVDVVLGGTTVDTSPDDPCIVDPSVTRRIIERCSLFAPSLADLRADDILYERVGLRPCRSHVRLEADMHGFAVPVVHAYGHGGAGITYSWGTAEEVVRLVDELVLNLATKKVDAVFRQ